MRKLLLVGAFVAVILSVWVGGNLYLARRLVIDPAWPRPVAGVLLALIAALAALPLLQPAVERALGSRPSRWAAWPGYLYMGLALLLLTALGLSDVVLGLAGSAFASESAATGGLAVARTQAVLVAATGLGAGGLALVSALRPPRTNRVELRLERWPAELDGFRIVQISDVHIGPLLDRRFARQVVDRVNALAPDLIAVTGDLVDGPVHDLAGDVAPLAELRARHGVFFVTGNHDYYSGADPWIAHIRTALGWRVLRNERVPIEQSGAGFDLAGVDDHRAYLFGRGHGEDVPRALAGRDPARAVVLLAHDPTTFNAVAKLGVDLQLSGHTHGGQIWPFEYFVRLFVPCVAGHHERDGSQLLVSRGTGFWGPPMRLRAPAEITEILLRPGFPAARAA